MLKLDFGNFLTDEEIQIGDAYVEEITRLCDTSGVTTVDDAKKRWFDLYQMVQSLETYAKVLWMICSSFDLWTYTSDRYTGEEFEKHCNGTRERYQDDIKRKVLGKPATKVLMILSDAGLTFDVCLRNPFDEIRTLNTVDVELFEIFSPRFTAEASSVYTKLNALLNFCGSSCLDHIGDYGARIRKLVAVGRVPVDSSLWSIYKSPWYLEKIVLPRVIRRGSRN